MATQLPVLSRSCAIQESQARGAVSTTEPDNGTGERSQGNEQRPWLTGTATCKHDFPTATATLHPDGVLSSANPPLQTLLPPNMH